MMKPVGGIDADRQPQGALSLVSSNRFLSPCVDRILAGFQANTDHAIRRPVGVMRAKAARNTRRPP